MRTKGRKSQTVRTKGKEAHIWSEKSQESERRDCDNEEGPATALNTLCRQWSPAQTKMAPNQDFPLKPDYQAIRHVVTAGPKGSQDITCGSRKEITSRQGLQSKPDVGYPGGIQLTRQARPLSDHRGVLPLPLPSLQAASGQADHSLL